MNKRRIKINVLTVIIFLSLTIPGIWYLWYSTLPYEEKIWIPENASIANFVDGRYIEISDIKISGTASEVPSLEIYQASFGNAHNNVYIRKDLRQGEIVVYYERKMDDKTYYHKDEYAYTEEDDILLTEKSLKLRTRYGGMLISISVLWVILSIFISTEVAKRLQKINWRKKF